jgi:N-acetyl-alpha-D-muramate 1-phosphate uridylyltransferase
MRALIFAAGLGTRMRPLTDTTPKPLLEVGGKPLIAWHLEKLARLGIEQTVINTAHLGAQFPQVLGDGSRWGLRIHYAHEGDTPLETGGGMLNALPLLGDAPFLAINGDIWTDADFAALPSAPHALAHLLLVDNPAHHPRGDFRLDQNGAVHDAGDGDGDGERLTFAGIGIYRPELLDHWRDVIGDTPEADRVPPVFGLAPLLRAAMRTGHVSGQHHRGHWTDVGTPQRLQALDAALRSA